LRVVVRLIHLIFSSWCQKDPILLPPVDPVFPCVGAFPLFLLGVSGELLGISVFSDFMFPRFFFLFKCSESGALARLPIQGEVFSYVILFSHFAEESRRGRQSLVGGKLTRLSGPFSSRTFVDSCAVPLRPGYGGPRPDPSAGRAGISSLSCEVERFFGFFVS